ncbi:acetamidase/formamidase family protein [Legionella bononiensis]|uniref:Acetamidase/formamidase family protein n=1 Tax=Legionella bononiensis TaxID=2793102 RepID=A0ABS1WDW6_9GAMM|nr:acetamidase/formamidase family protein [Legionella bononiensis]MBL7479586.1 acetamidase/formamidase family protein [Legionella bononiensis]MBL7527537.1 acetamidase/formamidase family protein [Legionella bononiensis]
MLNKIQIFVLLIAMVFFSVVSAENFRVSATKDTVTLGLYTLDKQPVVKVHSGDSVSIETWNSCLHEMVYNKTTPAEVAQFYTKYDIQKRRGMHSLTGPVYIEEAEPGDVLEIRILDIKLNDFGYNFLSPTAGILSEFTQPRIMYFKYNKEKNATEFTKGICLRLKPFPGVVAVAPPQDWPDGWPVNLETHMGQPVAGQFNSVPPGPFGGNLDEPSLQVGSILYLPVFQKGALVWTGDSHAMQSNGEIDVTALETSYEGITMQFIVRKDLKAEGVFDKTKRNGNSLFTWPIVENSEEWIVMGLNQDLFEAMQLASRNAIELLVRTQGFSAQESYQFLSMVGNFDIPEAVNVIKNVAVHIPKASFKNLGKMNTLSSAGTFPLTKPKRDENANCPPQEGKIIQ